MSQIKPIICAYCEKPIESAPDDIRWCVVSYRRSKTVARIAASWSAPRASRDTRERVESPCHEECAGPLKEALLIEYALEHDNAVPSKATLKPHILGRG